MPDRELHHWGIKGMRWGVRRYQNEDGSLTPAGKARYQKAYDKEVRKYMNEDGTLTKKGDQWYGKYDRYSDRLKNELKKYPEVDPSILRKIPSSKDVILRNAAVNARDKLAKKGIYVRDLYSDDNPLSKRGELLDEMKRKTKQMTPEEDCLAADPYKNDKDIAYRNTLPGVMAFELRRRGYDVQAKKNPFLERYSLFGNYDEVFSEKGLNDLTSQLRSKILSGGKDSRGYIHASCLNDMFQYYVAYEVVNGKLKLYDTATGRVYNDILDNPVLKLSDPSWIGFERLDNVNLNEFETEEAVNWYMTSPGYAVESRKGK